VLGEEDEVGIEGTMLGLAGALAVDHVEKIAGRVQVGERIQRLLAGAQALVSGKDGGHCAGQAIALLTDGVVLPVVLLRVLHADDGDADFEGVDGGAGHRQGADDVHGGCGEIAVLVEVGVDLIELGLGG